MPRKGKFEPLTRIQQNDSPSWPTTAARLDFGYTSEDRHTPELQVAVPQQMMTVFALYLCRYEQCLDVYGRRMSFVTYFATQINNAFLRLFDFISLTQRTVHCATLKTQSV